MAIINRTDGVNIDEERCGGCDRVDVVKRVVRGGYGEIRCFTCTPKNAFERLEDRRGKTYGAGESPEQDIAELLDIVEESERSSASISTLARRADFESRKGRRALKELALLAAHVPSFMRGQCVGIPVAQHMTASFDGDSDARDDGAWWQHADGTLERPLLAWEPQKIGEELDGLHVVSATTAAAYIEADKNEPRRIER